MKRLWVGALVLLLLAGMGVQAEAAKERDPILSFIVGCCFGIRTVGDYNEGKELHSREWFRLVPFVGVVFAVWDGIEGSQGMTTAKLQAKYGAMFY